MKRQANACRLLTPGPVSIEASVLEAMTCCPSPADAAFISMMEDVRRRLLRVAGMRPAEYAAVLTAGPCAFALEAALTTLIPEESRVLVVCNGAASIDVLVSGADCGLKASPASPSCWPAVAFSSRPKDEHTATRSTSSKACAGRKPESRTSCRLRPSPPCMPRWTLPTRRAASPCARRPP
ncbi:MAG: hypothetical protein ACLUNV_09620 [Sutterella wadsworthensis]